MKKRVLIVCTGNSCRSQMAEGLLRSLSGGSVEVASAGTYPSSVHPLAIKVLKEIGIDISGHRSKSVNMFLEEQFDYIITVCDHARDRCPLFPGEGKRFHIPFEDPVMFGANEIDRIEKFREVRDTIQDTMKKFLAEELTAR